MPKTGPSVYALCRFRILTHTSVSSKIGVSLSIEETKWIEKENQLRAQQVHVEIAGTSSPTIYDEDMNNTEHIWLYGLRLPFQACQTWKPSQIKC